MFHFEINVVNSLHAFIHKSVLTFISTVDHLVTHRTKHERF